MISMKRLFVTLVAALALLPSAVSAASLSLIPDKLALRGHEIGKITIRYLGGGLHDPISANSGNCTGVTVRPTSLVHARRFGRNNEWELMQNFSVSGVPAPGPRSCKVEFKAGSLRAEAPVTIK
jgi:hypothetical protein